MPDEVEEMDNFLDCQELITFFEHVKEHGLDYDMVAFSTLAYSGLRVGELVTLKESDVDFRNHTISVNKTYFSKQRTKEKYSILPPKTKGSIRKIEIDPFVIKLIKEHLKVKKKLK